MKNRKISKLLLVSGVICSSLILSPISASFASNNHKTSVTQQVKKNTTGIVRVKTALNVRSRATTKSSVIGSLRNNQRVTILGTQGSFYKISYRGKTAYVSKDYVSVANAKKASFASNNHKTAVTQQVKKNTTGTVRVKTALNVRSRATTRSSVIGTLRNNQKVTILGTQGSFYKISYRGKTAYVSKDYVSVANAKKASFTSNNHRTSVTQQVKKNTTGTVRVKTALNVRSRATTRSSVIGTLRNNQKVTILGTQGSFYKINYRGKTGYVSKDYVSVANTKTNAKKKATVKKSSKKATPKKVVKKSNNNKPKQNDKKITSTLTIGTINVSSYLNIRNGASPEAGITGSLGKNQKVSIIGQLGNFFKIDLNGKFGYISKDFVLLKDKSNNPMKMVRVNAKSGLNMRAVASAKGKVLKTIPDNVTLSVKDSSNKWLKVSYNGHTGWVSSDYATEL